MSIKDILSTKGAGIVSAQLTPMEQRRLLRIAFGACAGFVICKLLDLQYGVFFTVYPMLLLGMLPTFNRLIASQFLISTLLVIVEVYLLYAFFTSYPVLMALAVFGIVILHFRLMVLTPYFLLGATSLVTLSTLLHFSSYPTTDVLAMAEYTLAASLLSVVFAAVLYWLIPEPDEVPPMPQLPSLTAAQVNHRILLGSILWTLSFIVFQVMNLQDSLSAQVATVLVLFPMTFQGSVQASLNRVKGTIYGVALALVVQVLMYDLIQFLPLVTISFFVTVLLTAKLHLIERVGSGMGFGALTTIGILYGQYIEPNQDMFYAAAYRLSSVAVALFLIVLCAYLINGLLNRFPLTRELKQDIEC